MKSKALVVERDDQIIDSIEDSLNLLGHGDNDEPDWLRVATLTPDELLAKCEAWQQEAAMRASNLPELNDTDWSDLCETLRVLAASRGLSGRAILDFEQTAIPITASRRPAFVKAIREARAVVVLLSDFYKAEIAKRRTGQDTNRLPPRWSPPMKVSRILAKLKACGNEMSEDKFARLVKKGIFRKCPLSSRGNQIMDLNLMPPGFEGALESSS